MSFKELKIKKEYRSKTDNVIKDFYIPVLQKAVVYKRAVGFFSSTALAEISKGITGLIQNGGVIQLVASPHLSEEDVEAIRKGYKDRNKVIEESLLNSLLEPKNKFEEERLNLLTRLISTEKLDIKIALLEENQEFGMFHEKMGLLFDANGNKIAFSGSMNETTTAMKINYEAFDVFCSWLDEGEKDRVRAKENAFEAIWNNCEPNIEVLDFPNVKNALIKKYTKPDSDMDVDKKQAENYGKDKWFTTPSWFNPYDYQNDAICKWEENGYNGIYDMATGTGKTLTGLASVARLNEYLNSDLGVIIVCPYQHLIEQWVEDIREFGVEPLICYSNYQWKRKFEYIISDFSLKIIKNFCVITTNATFATNYFQKQIDLVKGNICLVVDEAHNFGAKKQLKCMKEIYKYRLALSATLERHHDEEGTERLKEFFGQKCIEYTLERAINENKLTPYYYYPVTIELSEEELDEYNELSEKIRKAILNSKNKNKLSEYAEMLLIKRARIIAGAKNKLIKLREVISERFVNENNILIYCGAANVKSDYYKQDEVQDEEIRQINAVVDILGNELNMRVSKFTSEEDSKERSRIKEYFSEGSMLQALVAIRCLDEGVNIPGIKTAFILASSTNPKEYIQRRGRVLRIAPNKPFAVIYDFITLPRDIYDPYVDKNDILSCEYSLIKREADRMAEFSRLCENPSDSIKLLDDVREFYNLYNVGGSEYEI